MSYVGFCEDCGIPFYEQDRMSHHHKKPLEAEPSPSVAAALPTEWPKWMPLQPESAVAGILNEWIRTFTTSPSADQIRWAAAHIQRYAEAYHAHKSGLTLSPRAKGPQCPKCGETDIYTRWHKDIEACPYSYPYTTPRFEGEHLHRHCRNCQYEWRDDIFPSESVQEPGRGEELPKAEELARQMFINERARNKKAAAEAWDKQSADDFEGSRNTYRAWAQIAIDGLASLQGREVSRG